MTLGDRDLGVHIYRTMARTRGDRPTLIAQHISRCLGVNITVLPATDDAVPTMIKTASGWLGLEEYFVRERCQPIPLDVEYRGSEKSSSTPEVQAALKSADVIVIAPSNPILSIGPILSIPGIVDGIRNSSARKIAVSPLIGGQAMKGPTLSFLDVKRIERSNAGIGRYYGDLVDSLIIDRTDAGSAASIPCEVHNANTLMTSLLNKTQLAAALLELANVPITSGAVH